MTALETLEALLEPNVEAFLKSLFVDDNIDYYQQSILNSKLPIIGDRSLYTSEPENLPYIRNFTKDNFSSLVEEMCASKSSIIVQYIRSEKNELRVLSLYLRLRDSV